MQSLVIEADEVVLRGGIKETGTVYVTVNGTKIESVSRTPPINAHHVSHLKTHLLCPGFVDIHFHGLGIVSVC